MVSTPECHLRLEMLPAHIPLSVAEKVLFIGEFILVFEHGALQENGKYPGKFQICLWKGLVLNVLNRLYEY